MQTFERWFVEANKWALILLLSGMSVVVFTNVSLRYLTNFSITWAEEVARYSMIWMTFLGAGLALRYGGHVAITNLQDALAGRMAVLLRAVIVLLILGFCAVMVWIGYDYMQRMRFQLTPATRLPFSYIYAAIPVGFALLIVHLLLIARGFVMGGDYREADALDERATLSG